MAGASAEMATVAGGELRSVLPLGPPGSETVVAPFWLDREPVTNADFAAFVREHPEWRRSRVARIFAAKGYLAAWPTDVDPPNGSNREPVTRVSWFAARAYCEARGRRLPTWHEWELAATDADRGLRGPRSEWVEDFGGLLVSADNREQSDPDTDKFCGSGALGMDRKDDYPVLMRVALLSSLRAADLTESLGFRCASTDEAAGEAAGFPINAEGPADSIYRLRAPLVDQSGAETTLAAFAGHPTLVSLFYASCPNVCPLLVASIRRLERELDEGTRRKLRILMVSLDPERDTPQALAALAERHALDLDRWKLARPREREVRAIAGLLDTPYRRLPGGVFNHASVITLVDPAGRIVARSTQLGTVDRKLVTRIRSLTSSAAAARNSGRSDS